MQGCRLYLVMCGKMIDCFNIDRLKEKYAEIDGCLQSMGNPDE